MKLHANRDRLGTTKGELNSSSCHFQAPCHLSELVDKLLLQNVAVKQEETIIGMKVSHQNHTKFKAFYLKQTKKNKCKAKTDGVQAQAYWHVDNRPAIARSCVEGKTD